MTGPGLHSEVAAGLQTPGAANLQGQRVTALPKQRTAGLQGQRATIHAGLHALSQPLTVVSLALTLAQASSSEAERTLALEAAMNECQRAMDSVRQLRAALDTGAPRKMPGLHAVRASDNQRERSFGGKA